jgi:hypothetical protein
MTLRGPRSHLAALFSRTMRRKGWHIVRAQNWHVIRRSYYAPVPDLELLPDNVWDQRTAMAGIVFDTAAQLAFAERELAPFIREAVFPRTAPAGTFALDNATYASVDAEVAYAMVRRFRPARVVELGSGHSTLALAQACAANAADGAATRLEAYDPFPRNVVPGTVPGLTAVHGTAAQDVPLEVFTSLGAGDVLFVDTTHAVRMGGDVNFVILEVLPRLADGVLVHFHDIWLPHEYHRALTEVLGMHWTEQYLLQAFLSGNPRADVLFATHAVTEDHRERLEALVPSFDATTFPTSFWLRIGVHEGV